MTHAACLPDRSVPLGRLCGWCVQVKCDYYNVNNNFVFFDDAQYFKTPDENHITSCADTTKLRASSDLITVIQVSSSTPHPVPQPP